MTCLYQYHLRCVQLEWYFCLLESNPRTTLSRFLKRADLLIYVFIIPSLILYHALDRAKFIYFLPLVFWVIILLTGVYSKNKKIQIDRNTGIGLLVYLVLAMLSIVAGFWSIEYSMVLRDVLIFSSPLVLFLPYVRFTELHAKFLFIASIISYVAWVGPGAFTAELSFRILTSNFNTNAEFHNGIIFGGFLLFFLDRKKWLWALAAFVIIFLTGKRAIYLGLAPALGFYYGFLLPTKIIDNREGLALSLFAYFMVFFFIGFFLIEVSGWFIDEFDDSGRLTVHNFLMGREKFIYGLKNEMARSGFLSHLFGHGPGQADYYLMSEIKPDWVHKNRPVNPHNDFLKLVFDYGWVGAISFFVVLYSFYVKTRYGVMMILYTIPLFLVDNSLIFVYYLFIGGVISRIES